MGADLLAAPRARLAQVPWDALPPLVGALIPALTEVLTGSPAERVLDRLLRSHRELDAAGRAVLAESLFGISLFRRFLRAQTSPCAPPLELLAIFLRDLAQRPTLLEVPLPPTRTLTDWRDLTSIPDWLADDLVHHAGADAPKLAAALNTPAPIFLRTNTLRTTREALITALSARGITAIPTLKATAGLEVTTPRPNLLGTKLEGHFEVQDEGSQLLGEILEAKPGDEVLDLCAGAGGKSLQLAAHVGATGLVHCTDLDLAKLERLRHRASRANARVAIHGALPPPALRVPRVLVDAPCSELGVLRRGPDVRWRLDPSTFTTLPSLQLSLLERGLTHLQPAGRLVYATCTLRREENEAVVEAALARHSELRLIHSFATRPDVDRCDGFFAALLERAR